ncbi:MAG: glycoside hydrolase domain-containing protein [Desulfobaccales bacterium]
MRRGGKILAVIGLAVYWGLPEGAVAVWSGKEFLGPPAITLNWGGPSGTVGAVSLSGARNEHLFLAVIIEGLPGPLKAGVEHASLDLKWAVFRVTTVPPEGPSQFPPDALVPLGEDLTGFPPSPVTIWVSLKISPECPAGRHVFQVVLSDNQRQVRLPVNLRVYRFSLPAELPVTLFAGFWHQGKPAGQGRPDLSAGNLALIKEYYRSLRDYKFNALGGSYPLPLGRLGPGQRIETYATYHDLISYALNQLKFRYVQMPRVKGWETAGDPGSVFCRAARVFYPLYESYLRRQGWEGRVLNYLVDEPPPAQSNTVIQAFGLAKSLAPVIKTLSAGWGEPSRAAGVIDIWAHQAAHYREEERARAQGRGQEAWLYANRLHTLGNPLAHPRLIGWLLYQYRFSGYLF